MRELHPGPRGRSRSAGPAGLALAAAALVLSFLVAQQFRTEQEVRRSLRVTSPQIAELAYRMQHAERIRADLEAEVAFLRRRIEIFTEEAGRRQRGLAALSAELQTLRALAGFTPVEGPGIVVELADNPRPLHPEENPNDVVLHYTDLVRVVGDLLGSGAEAIAINDERLVGTSGIECVGTTVLLNQRRLSPPFRIAAIGDAAALVRGVSRRGSSLDMLKAFGFPVRVTRLATVRVPAYRGALALAR